MKTDATQPLISVVTPVHNGEAFLAQCIESVLAQSYSNWQYTIVNNCSRDRSREIAGEYAARDSRIHIVDTPEFYPIIANWNFAMRQIGSQCKYCKVLHADDWMFSICLELMLAVAEQSDQIGIVSSLRFEGDSVRGTGLPYPCTHFPGKQVCLLRAWRRAFVFGSPSNLLLRADLVRARPAFYNESFMHADTEVCYDLLRYWDFGFVHQVLTGTRLHSQSQTSQLGSVQNTFAAEGLAMLVKYGPELFSPNEFRAVMEDRLAMHYRFLVQNCCRSNPLAFLRFHYDRLQSMGMTLEFSRLLSALGQEMRHTLLEPKRLFKNINLSHVQSHR